MRHLSSMALAFSCKSAKERIIPATFFLMETLFSDFKASFSISNFWISCLTFSSSAGSDSISSLKAEAASSIKSTALSGRKRSLM